MNTTTSPQTFDPTIRGACPATGRSASVCIDQTHTSCYVGLRESLELDRKVQRELDRSAV